MDTASTMILLEKELPRILVCIVGSRFQIFCFTVFTGRLRLNSFFYCYQYCFFFNVLKINAVIHASDKMDCLSIYFVYLSLYQNNHKQTLRFTYSFPLFFCFPPAAVWNSEDGFEASYYAKIITHCEVIG